MQNVLTRYHKSQDRLRIVYGDTKTGCDWLEEYDVIGTVGMSTGTVKAPLIIARWHYSGAHILDQCILKIVDVKTKVIVYQHENYKEPSFTIKHKTCIVHGCVYAVLCRDIVHANFKTEKQAKNYIDFMLCKRMRK